jgi:hypothetical protein
MPAKCFTVGAWRSLVAHCNGVAGVGGSNPLAPTKENKDLGENLGPFILPSHRRKAFVKP